MKELTPAQIFAAIPSPEPDRGKIKWRKRKWKLPRNKTTCTLQRNRPKAEVYWEILRQNGRNLSICEACGSDYRITVHHSDGNPHNNHIENLQVLCWNCHALYHDPTEQGVRDEMEGTMADDS